MHSIVGTFASPNELQSWLRIALLLTSDITLDFQFFEQSQEPFLEIEQRWISHSLELGYWLNTYYLGVEVPQKSAKFESTTSCWLSWFCIATVKLSILELMFSRSLSVAWILLPKSSLIFSWSLTISLRDGSFLLKFWPLPPCWRLSKGKLGLFHPELKPWFRQKPLLEFPIKLTSWWTVGQLTPIWAISPQSSHVIWVSTILRWSRLRSSSFFMRKLILAVSISTSLSWWTLRVQVWVCSSIQLWLEAIFSINAWASSVLRAKNEPPAATSICSLAKRISPW
jgi:hypothetical protein